MTCKDCAFYKDCKKPKDKLCKDFIIKDRRSTGPVVVKTNRIKKG